MGKTLRKKTGGENRYAEKPDAPETAGENASEFATKSEVADVKQGIDVLTGEMKTVGETVTALLESLKGSEKTPAQKQEMVSKQLADATEINERPKRAIPVFGENTVKIGDDFLIKGITPLTPRVEANKIFYTALKSPTESEAMIELQTRCDRMKMKCEMLGKQPHQLREFEGFQTFLEKTGFEDVIHKIIGTGTTTDFVPEGWSNEVQKYYYLALKVASLFNEFTMPQNPFRWDILGRPSAKLRGEPTASLRGTIGNEVVATDPVQGVVTFDAVVLTVRVDLTEEFTEDAIDTYYDTLSREVIPEALAEGVETAIINGDVTGTHQDNGITATDPENAWQGLRKDALVRTATVDVTADSGAFNYGRLTELIGAGGKYLLSAADTAWVCDTEAYTKVLNFSEVTTIDNFGMNATNVQGAVMMLMGRPMVVSEHLPLVNDAGVVHATATDNTHGTMLLVNRRQYRMGNIPREGVEMLWDPLTRFHYIISTCRKDFQSMEPRAAGYTPAAMTLKI